MTISDALTYGTRLLSQSRTDSPSLDAEVLLAHVLNKPKEFLYSHAKVDIDSLPPGRGEVEEGGRTTMQQFNHLLSRRSRGEPVAYLTGHREFFGLDFLVTPDVLIPRPATEDLVELVLQHLQHTTNDTQQTIIDIGTGSGCIATTLAKHIPNARITAIDISEKTLKVARKNAKLHNVTNKIHFLKGNLASPFLNNIIVEQYNNVILVSNLPYLTPQQYNNNPDLSWEPKTALVGGRDGCKYFQQLARQIKKLPALPKAIFLEIDPSQKTTIKKLFSPLYRASFKKDLLSLTRYLILTQQ